MKRVAGKAEKPTARETLTEAYEVRAFRNEEEEPRALEAITPEIPHAEQGALQAIKGLTKGHGEQTVLPDDCQYGDNDMCFVES